MEMWAFSPTNPRVVFKKLFPILGRYNGELCRCAAFCANVRPFAEITIGRYARKMMDDMRDKNFEL